MKSQSEKKQLFLVGLVLTLLALFIRLEYYRSAEIDNPFRGDARSYLVYGYNLAVHETFSKEMPHPSQPPRPDSFWAPGFPLLVAFGIKIGGLKNHGFYPVVMLMQVVEGSLIIPLVFWVGLLFLPRWGAATAAFLTAISPHLISIGGYFLTEITFALFQWAALAVFCAAIRSRRKWLFALSGALFGYAYLTNPVILLLPFILPCLLIAKGEVEPRKLSDQRISLAIFLICFSVFWAGWSIRGAANVDKAQSDTRDRAVENLVIGYHPEFFDDFRSGRYHAEPNHPVKQDKRASGGSLVKAAKILLARFRDEPGRYFVWYALEKPYLLWSWNLLVGQGDIYVYPYLRTLYKISWIANASRLLMKWLHPFILAMALIGLFSLIRRIRLGTADLLDPPVLLYLTVVYITSIYVLFQSEPRYSIPFRPELYLCAVWSVCTFISAVKSKILPVRSKEEIYAD